MLTASSFVDELDLLAHKIPLAILSFVINAETHTHRIRRLDIAVPCLPPPGLHQHPNPQAPSWPSPSPGPSLWGHYGL